jgi:hypothetical protein
LSGTGIAQSIFSLKLNWKNFLKNGKKMEKYATILMFVLGVSGKSADYTALGGIRYDGKRI